MQKCVLTSSKWFQTRCCPDRPRTGSKAARTRALTWSYALPNLKLHTTWSTEAAACQQHPWGLAAASFCQWLCFFFFLLFFLIHYATENKRQLWEASCSAAPVLESLLSWNVYLHWKSNGSMSSRSVYTGYLYYCKYTQELPNLQPRYGRVRQTDVGPRIKAPGLCHPLQKQDGCLHCYCQHF